MGGNEQKEKTAQALKNSKAFIKNELKPAVASRWLPDLRFFMMTPWKMRSVSKCF